MDSTQEGTAEAAAADVQLSVHQDVDAQNSVGLQQDGVASVTGGVSAPSASRDQMQLS
jgi:hypothetical protein